MCGSATKPGSPRRRRARKIADVVFERPRMQRGAYGVFVDERVAREVEQHGAGLHRREPRRVEHVARHGEERHMQRDEIGLPQQLLGAARLAHARRQTPCRVDGDLRIEADDIHPELDGGVRDQAADGAEAEDAERAPRELDAGKLLLGVFDLAVEVRRLRVEARDELKRRNDVARRQQQRGQHELLHRVGVGARRVEHRHAALRHLCHRDVVGSRPGAADGLDTRPERHGVHVVRAHQDGVGLRRRSCRRRSAPRGSGRGPRWRSGSA